MVYGDRDNANTDQPDMALSFHSLADRNTAISLCELAAAKHRATSPLPVGSTAELFSAPMSVKGRLYYTLANIALTSVSPKLAGGAYNISTQAGIVWA